MEPRIQYAKTSDGVSIAYAVFGDGPPIIFTSPVFGGLHLYSSGVIPLDSEGTSILHPPRSYWFIRNGWHLKGALNHRLKSYDSRQPEGIHPERRLYPSRLSAALLLCVVQRPAIRRDLFNETGLCE